MKIEIIPTKGWLYDKCENMEQLYNKYYYPLLVEYKELKKQLEDNKLNHKQLKDLNKIQKSFIKVKTQQQEFIEYMRELSNWYSADGVKQGLVNGILQKYKEIIGGNNEEFGKEE